VRALYAVAAPYQRSVIDRFATVAAACRMAVEAGLLWRNANTDRDIEACTVRWAAHEKMDRTVDTVVAAIARFMRGRPAWQGTASQLQTGLDGAIDSPDSLGRWLRKPENLQGLQLAGFKVVLQRDTARDRSRLIRIERVGVE
jgi:hypothetical protein